MTSSRSTTAAEAWPSRYRRLAGGALVAFIALAAPIRADDVPANLLPDYTVTSSFSGRSRHTGANSVSVLFDNSTTTYIGFNQSSATLYINFTLNEAVVANAYGVVCGPSAYYAATGRAYWLAKGSPCVNAGTNLNWTATDIDLAGRRRIVSRVVDIGCFEQPLDPGTVLSVR